MQISVLAQKLNIYTLQSVALSQGKVIVPNLDGQLLKVTPQGSTVLVDLLKAELGVPFGITDQNQDLIVTVSGYLPEHYLVRVQPNGTPTKIADLSEISGIYGAPFGVAVYQNDYLVTLSDDVTESTGRLLRVSQDGKVTSIAPLTQYGNPFGIAVRGEEFIIAQSGGHLVRSTLDGKVTSIVDLKTLGFGIPFDVAVWRDRLVATTNTGQVIQIDAAGKPSTIADVLKAKYGIPSGIAVNGEDLVVTTNGGFVLNITGL